MKGIKRSCPQMLARQSVEYLRMIEVKGYAEASKVFKFGM